MSNLIGLSLCGYVVFLLEETNMRFRCFLLIIHAHDVVFVITFSLPPNCIVNKAALPKLVVPRSLYSEMSFNQSAAGSSRFQFDLMDLSSQGVNDILKAGEPMVVGRGGDDEDSSQFSMSPQDDQETDYCLRTFENWAQARQTEFVEQLIARMSFHQHEHIYSILMPMLQRDFITVLPSKDFVCCLFVRCG